MRQTLRYGSVRLCVVALIVCVLMPHTVLAEFETPTAITNVTIVPSPGVKIESGTVVLFKGRIVEVGADVDLPPHAEQIDGAGLTVYAGFIDAHSHLGIPEKVRTLDQRRRTEDTNPDPREGALASTRLANRRGIRPQFRAMELFAPESKTLEAHRAAGFTAALIAPRDGILSGTSDLMVLSDLPLRRRVLASDVWMHGSFKAGEEGEYPRSLLGVFAQFRQALLDAAWYAKMQKYTARHPSAGPRAPIDEALESLQPLLGRSQRLLFEANSEDEIRRALDLVAEFNLSIGITGGKEAWKVIDRLRAERVPLIVSLKFDEEPEYGKKKETKRSPEKQRSDKADKEAGSKSEPGSGKQLDKKKIYEPLKARKERRRLWEEQVANVIRLHEAGVAFALRTRDFKSTDEFFKNLRLVIDRGLPEEAALAALTIAPAELLGLSDQLGEIRRGRFANLTLMTGPLLDKKAKVRFVFIEGKKFEVDRDDGKDKKKTNGDKKDPDSSAKTSEGANKPGGDVKGDAPEGKHEEPPAEGPAFAVEIKADRMPSTKTGGSVLIQNATILPVSSPAMQRASILIQDGKITAIGPNLPAPAGVMVIDGTNRFVIPGLVDCHSHLGADGVNEGTMAITAEVRIADVLNPNHAGIFRAAAGGATTHHVMHGSANPIGGQNAIVKLKYGRPVADLLIPDAPPTIKFALGENVTQANWQKAWGKRFPNSRMGVEAVIRSALQAGRDYRERQKDYDRQTSAGQDHPPLRRDLRLEALAGVLDGTQIVHAHCYRSDEILRLMQVAEDYGFRIGTMQHVLEGYRIADEIAQHGAAASTFSNFWAYKVEAYGAIPHNAALMTRRGVNVSVNSDSPNTIRHFGQEAAKSIKWGGLDETEALKLVTVNPAMQLKIYHRVGSLEVGKDGDVAIFNGHPLNSFSKCIMTLIDGEVFFEDPRPDPIEPASTLNIPQNIDRTIPEARHRAYAIVGATVHPISGSVIESGTVVVVEDKIHAVGVDAVVPPGAGVIDGTGLHVYPGLIDAGGSMGLVEVGALRATRDSSDIAPFAPHLRAESAVHPHSQHIRVSRTTGIATVLTQPSGGRISGQSAIIHLDGWTTPEMLVESDFGLHMTVPSEPVRWRGDEKEKKKRKAEHKKAVRELEEFMAKAKHYAKVKRLLDTGLTEAGQDGDTVGRVRRPDASKLAGHSKLAGYGKLARQDFKVDLVLEAMVPYVRAEKPVIFRTRGYKQILDTIAFSEKHGLRCVLSGATGAWKCANLLAEKKIPVILSGPLSYPWGEFEPWDSIYRCAGVLDRAGVKFCFASGSASGAYNLPIQVAMAVAHGLPRERAEYALTLGAAEILGIADRVGSIEVGKIADLIVTTDTPLQTVSQVTHMFIAGRPVELTSVHTESYEKFKNRPRP